MSVIPVLLTCEPEQRGFAEAVGVSVFEQVEAGQRGVQEEAGLGVGLQGVVAGDPGVPAKDEGGSVPECLALLPLGQLHLAAGARVQEEVRSVGRLKGNPRRVCVHESKVIHHHHQGSVQKLDTERSVCCVKFDYMMNGLNLKSHRTKK